MELLQDCKDPPDDYWNDFGVENEDFDEGSKNTSSRQLLNEINLKDLCDGKEVMFETGKGFLEDDFDAGDDVPVEVTYSDTKSLRENRGAPPLTTSFQELSSKMTNLTEDGLVKKQVISCGVGKVVPDNAYVTVHYNLYKENCELPFDSTYLRNRPEKFKLGQGEALLGLECAIKSMKKSENSIFFIKWELAFGAMGCPDRIGKKCDIVADITLMNFMEINAGDSLTDIPEEDAKNFDFSKFINQTKKQLCNGSDEFSKGDTKAAVSCYRKALKILNTIRLENEEQERIMLQNKLKCLVNLAICYNKLGKHESACLACQEALSIDSNNSKANFHYGRANLALSNFPAAQKYLFRANSLKPNDKDINMELKKLNDKKALYNMKDKEFWKKALTADNEKEDSKEPSPLDKFESQLLTSLQQSITEGKSYALPLPLSEGETKVCNKVAAKLDIDFETHPQFCVFKMKKNSKEDSI